MTQRILRSMIASSEEFLTVSTVNDKGAEITKVYHPSLEGKVRLKDRSADETFIKAKDSGKFAISPLYYENNIPMLNVVYPFTGDVFLYIEASLARLLEKVQNTTIGKTGFAYMVNDQGRIVMHRDISRALNFESVSGLPVVKEVLSRHLVGSKEYLTGQGKRVIGAYAPVAALNWGVIVQQDKDEAYLSVTRMRKNALILLVTFVVLASVMSYLLTRNLTSPILKLTSDARTIAKGNFKVDAVAGWLKKVRIKDEMAELASTFITMTGELKRYTDMQADRMNAVLFSIADGIIMTDYSGRIMLSNRKAKELLGISPKESMENRNIQEMIKSAEISESLSEVRDKKENITKEINLSEKERPKFLRTDTSLVSQSESGEELGTVTVVRDITLEKELEQLKDDFIHSITHDLRSPMTSIRGFLEFLLDGSAGEVNEQQKEFLNIIDDSSGRLLNMINDILDVAKMEAGKMPMNIEEVNFADIAESVLQTLELQAKKDNVHLRFEKSNDIKNITADRNLITRTMTNLISNALKFTPEQGEVKLALEDKQDRVLVAVEDTGEGMPADYVSKIFDKFEQVKGSKGRRKGTGLGLTITKYIVEAHEGRIWAESEQGKGSRFSFWIPRGLEKNAA
jgi:PAS domain S-box-containing protein